MPSGHKKGAIKQIRSRYGAGWKVKTISDGVALLHVVSPDLARHVHFTFVRDDALGLRIQPGLAVTFPAVNAARDLISPRNQHTIDGFTGFVFLNNVIDPTLRQHGGWLFETNVPLQPALDNFLTFVDESIRRSGFFESLTSIDDYIAARETNRWAFITGVLPYLYALIAKGQIAKAKKIAAEHRAKSIQIGIERGFVQRESDLLPYDEILKMPESMNK
jgi:hypothetical protein